MINIKALVFNPLQVNTYIIWDNSRECVIIDPSFCTEAEQNVFLEFIQSKDLNPAVQLNTHCHVDHLPGVNFIKKKFGLPFSAHTDELHIVANASLMGKLFGFDLEPLEGIDRLINDNELIKFGTSELKALHVPGHSMGSLAFYSEQSKFVVTGDALFNGSIGRTDLPGGDYDTLIHSIKSRLFSLPGETLVYPGHGPHSSIQRELTANPFF